MRKERDGMVRIGGATIALALFGAASCGQQPGARRGDRDAPGRGGAGQQRPRPGARDTAGHDSQVSEPVAALLHLRAEVDAQRARADHEEGVHRPDREVQRAAAALGVSLDAAVRLRRRRVREVRRQRPAAANDRRAPDDRADGSSCAPRPGRSSSSCAWSPTSTHYRNELAGDHLAPVDPTLDWANPNNFPKPTPPFAPFPPGYPQAQSPITHTTHTHGLEVRPVVRRHARHLVHDQRHRRSGIRVERLQPTKQQPGGAVLVSRPRVRRHPSGRRVRAVRVRDLARSGRRAARSPGQ